MSSTTSLMITLNDALTILVSGVIILLVLLAIFYIFSKPKESKEL